MRSTSHPTTRNSSSPSTSPTITHLQSQLIHLTTLQSTLLSSYTSTASSLSPNAAPTALTHYHRIAPILSQIPTYQRKLARLRNQMAAQRNGTKGLRDCALEVQRRRGENRERIVKRRDRTVLRVRMAVERQGEGGVEEGGASPSQLAGGERGSPVLVVVKRKKKARRVKMWT